MLDARRQSFDGRALASVATPGEEKRQKSAREDQIARTEREAAERQRAPSPRRRERTNAPTFRRYGQRLSNTRWARPSASATSALPSPSKSPAASAAEPPVNVPSTSANVPSPRPVNSPTVAFGPAEITKSSRPSALKSPPASEVGSPPAS